MNESNNSKTTLRNQDAANRLNPIPTISSDKWDRGAIIGSVEIVDCVINHPSIWAEKPNHDYGAICHKNKCEQFVEWDFGHGICKSCKLVGQSYIVDTVPPDCIYKKYMPKPTYNWVVADPILFDKPILNVKGRLSFWESECEILVCPKCYGYTLYNNKDISVPNWGNSVCECEKCGHILL